MADYSIVQEAVHRGYSMDEIADKLASDAGYDPALLHERGYDSNAILLKLGYSAPKQGIEVAVQQTAQKSEKPISGKPNWDDLSDTDPTAKKTPNWNDLSDTPIVQQGKTGDAKLPPGFEYVDEHAPIVQQGKTGDVKPAQTASHKPGLLSDDEVWGDVKPAQTMWIEFDKAQQEKTNSGLLVEGSLSQPDNSHTLAACLASR